MASPFKSAYVAAKHGLLGLTKTIGLEAAEHGVTVNAICPGYVLTPLEEKHIPETAKPHEGSSDQGRAFACAANAEVRNDARGR